MSDQEASALSGRLNRTAEGRSFDTEYASLYDLFYAQKDYVAEASLLDQFIRTHRGASASIADVGCGTGRHAIELARRGHHIVGIDASEFMLRRAEARAQREGQRLMTVMADAARLPLKPGTFDVATMMFAVLGYLGSAGSSIAALKMIHRALRPGGLLIFDVWYGPAVLKDPPRQRVRIASGPHGEEVIRVAFPTLDPLTQDCLVQYLIWRIDRKGTSTRVEERHRVHYFFPTEIENLLAATGYEKLHWFAFPDGAHPPDDQHWNVLVVAKRT